MRFPYLRPRVLYHMRKVTSAIPEGEHAEVGGRWQIWTIIKKLFSPHNDTYILYSRIRVFHDLEVIISQFVIIFRYGIVLL
jgi:hypothetical protein